VRLLAIALEKALAGLVVLHPDSPTVLVDDCGYVKRGLAGLRISRIANNAASISQHVHHVPNLGTHPAAPVVQMTRNSEALNTPCQGTRLAPSPRQMRRHQLDSFSRL
jgi:hypothetical protein